MNGIDVNARRGSAVSCALALVIALVGCGKGGHEDKHDDEHAAGGEKHAEHGEGPSPRSSSASGGGGMNLSAGEAEAAGIRVEEVKVVPIGETLNVTATSRPDQDRLAHVAPRIAGRIVSAPVKLGDRVAAGQVLATLDSVEVGEAHAAWMQAQAELRIAEADFERARALDADEIIPRKDFLRARADRDKAQAAARSSTDRLRLLGGTANASAAGASGFAVTSPLAGTVIEKKAVVGTLSSPSEPLFAVADLGRVWIQADLPEAAVAKVRLGAVATVSVPAYPRELFEGRVGHLGAALDKETRTLAARIEVANADGRLKPEMFATVSIEVASAKRDAIAVPEAAVVLMDGQPTVFVHGHGGYEMRPVDPGERIGGRVVLRSGLKAGERAVVEGAFALKARQQKSQLGHGH